MFQFSDLFQWERFITPSVIKLFYWLVVGLIGLSGLIGVISGLGTLMVSPGLGFISVITSVLGVVIGILFARISAEFILIVFRINEHLGVIRGRAES